MLFSNQDQIYGFFQYSELIFIFLTNFTPVIEPSASLHGLHLQMDLPFYLLFLKRQTGNE